MAYEAMNNAGAMDARLIVILNDNDMSIAPPVGAMSAYLARLVSSRPYRGLRELGKQIAHWLPQPMEVAAKRAEEYARGMATGGTLFEELGFYYVGPIDGHNLDHLIPVLENVRDTKNGPILVHVVTQEGQGLCARRRQRRQISRRLQVQRADRRAEEIQPQGAELSQGVRRGADRAKPKKDERIVAITAAMPSGTGLDMFAEGVPGAHLRCRHRRAACRDLRGRPGGRRHEAVLRDLFDLPAARLRPGRARRGDPVAAGALCHRPRRARRRRRPDPCRRLRHRLSRQPAGLRA